MTTDPSPTDGVREGSDATLEIGTIVDGYRIEQVIGRGGMGLVYGVVNTMIGKRAALKVLRPQFGANTEVVERFITEARAVNQIGHPNIVDIFGFGTIGDDQPYMVMEWLKGETLGDRMQRDVPLGEICEVLLSVASALEAAHTNGIAHRDLKPDNVFLAAHGKTTTVKLLDFGIAKLMTRERQLVQRTQTGMVMGTPAYMSPEQARGKDIDQRTDIYSLGIIAFELLCRRSPFAGETAMDLVVAHIHEPAPPPSSIVEGISPAIDSLVLAMLEKDPAARPTLTQISAALEEIRGGGTALSTVPPRTAPIAHLLATTPPAMSIPSQATIAPTTSAKPRRPWWIAIAVSVVLAAAVVIVATRMSATKEAPPEPRPQAPPTEVVRSAAPPKPPVADEVSIEFSSSPPGARVRIKGTDDVLGTTPFSRRFPRSANTQTFELELAGHETKTQTIAAANDGALHAALALSPVPVTTPVKPIPGKQRPKTRPNKVDRSGTMNVFDDDN